MGESALDVRAVMTDAEKAVGPAANRRLAPLVPRTLPEQVADRLVHAIGRGVLKPDERLIEAELARELDVSRVPVREALRMLANQGVVRAEPNRGVRVVRFDDAKIEQLTAARCALEKLAARRAAARIRREPTLIDEMRNVIAAMRNCADGKDIPGLNRADIMFHDALYRVSGSGTLIELWRTIARQVEIIFAMEIYRVEDPLMLTKEHVVLCTALCAGDDAALDREVERHIAGLHTLGAASRGKAPHFDTVADGVIPSTATANGAGTEERA